MSNPARDFALNVSAALLLHKCDVTCVRTSVLLWQSSLSHAMQLCTLSQAEKAKKKLPFGTIDYTGLQQNVSPASCRSRSTALAGTHNMLFLDPDSHWTHAPRFSILWPRLTSGLIYVSGAVRHWREEGAEGGVKGV